MAAPKFGLALSFQVHQGLGEPWDKSYREGIELAVEASRLGFDAIWVSEHHGEADGYCPSPVVACAALAVAESSTTATPPATTPSPARVRERIGAPPTVNGSC